MPGEGFTLAASNLACVISGGRRWTSFGAGERVGQRTAGSLLWALTDNQNTVRDLAAFNGGQTSVADSVYDAFGNLSSQVNPSAADCIFGYTGRPYDSATGLQNNLAAGTSAPRAAG